MSRSKGENDISIKVPFSDSIPEHIIRHSLPQIFPDYSAGIRPNSSDLVMVNTIETDTASIAIGTEAVSLLDSHNNPSPAARCNFVESAIYNRSPLNTEKAIVDFLYRIIGIIKRDFNTKPDKTWDDIKTKKYTLVLSQTLRPSDILTELLEKEKLVLTNCVKDIMESGKNKEDVENYLHSLDKNLFFTPDDVEMNAVVIKYIHDKEIDIEIKNNTVSVESVKSEPECICDGSGWIGEVSCPKCNMDGEGFNE